MRLGAFRYSAIGAALIFLAGTSLNGQPASQPGPIDTKILSRGPSALRLWNPYRQTPLPPVNTKNGPLLERSIHDGKLELSLADFLALVVEKWAGCRSGPVQLPAGPNRSASRQIGTSSARNTSSTPSRSSVRRGDRRRLRQQRQCFHRRHRSSRDLRGGEAGYDRPAREFRPHFFAKLQL